MVNWGTAEPCPRGGSAWHVVQSMWEKQNVSANTTNLVFDHFHADLQAFSTDVTNNLILVSEFCEFCHEIGAHIQADLLRAILLNSLSRKLDSLNYYPRCVLI